MLERAILSLFGFDANSTASSKKELFSSALTQAGVSTSLFTGKEELVKINAARVHILLTRRAGDLSGDRRYVAGYKNVQKALIDLCALNIYDLATLNDRLPERKSVMPEDEIAMVRDVDGFARVGVLGYPNQFVVATHASFLHGGYCMDQVRIISDCVDQLRMELNDKCAEIDRYTHNLQPFGLDHEGLKRVLKGEVVVGYVPRGSK